MRAYHAQVRHLMPAIRRVASAISTDPQRALEAVLPHVPEEQRPRIQRALGPVLEGRKGADAIGNLLDEPFELPNVLGCVVLHECEVLP